MLQYFAYVLILATIVSKLEGYQVEYKISSTNCNFTDIAIRHWTTSLAMCAALCTQAAVCNGFTRKGDDCALLETCPPSCNVATEIDDRRTVHCLADATDNPPVPKDCLEILEEGQTSSNVYTIRPGDKTTRALCNMHTDGGGWTVFQRRLGGGVHFYRDWDEYKDGFGDPLDEHWLGNINLHQLTTGRSCQLRIDMVDRSLVEAYAKYDVFSVGDENSGFLLTVNGYSGTAGFDSMEAHNGKKFTTKDRDFDQNPSDNCAILSKGGFWYAGCHLTNLNGKYGPKGVFWEGVTWKHYKGASGYHDLLQAMMMVKCSNV